MALAAGGAGAGMDRGPDIAGDAPVVNIELRQGQGESFRGFEGSSSQRR